jgi:transposase InsO family protein
MPWAERCIVGSRKDFVVEALAKEMSFSAVCRKHGVSRKTGYKWLERFKKGGWQDLVDEGRRPGSSPLKTSADVAMQILDIRKAHATWGPRKIHRLLEKKLGPDAEVPSVRTIARVLQAARLVRKRRRRPNDQGRALLEARRHVTVEGPNDLWTVDFKGWWLAGDGTRCEPLTVRDAHSRFVLALEIVPSTDGHVVRGVFERLFERYGLPRAILSDNGPPFASPTSLCGLTRLSVWFLSLGIDVVHSRPGCPQDNGAHERMHRDMRAELQATAAASVAAQQARCAQWQLEFNHVRPHEALAMRTPAEDYSPSQRRLKDVPLGGFFPEDCDLVTLTRRGSFKYRRMDVRVSKALSQLEVGVERVKPGATQVRIWFHRLLLGFFPLGTDRPYVPVEPFLELATSPYLASAVTRSDTGDIQCHDGGATSEDSLTPPPLDGRATEAQVQAAAFQTAMGTASPFPVDSPQTACPPESPHRLSRPLAEDLFPEEIQTRAQ